MSDRESKFKKFNFLCKLFYRSEYLRFIRIRNTEDIEATQRKYLRRMLHANRNTIYGRQYQFANIRNYQQFVEQVPLTTYEDYEPYIDRIAKGEKHVLTWEEVLLFELTSGSTKGKKLIPYTKTLKKEFQKGIKPWLYDIFHQVEGVMEGQSYWSITPIANVNIKM